MMKKPRNNIRKMLESEMIGYMSGERPMLVLSPGMDVQVIGPVVEHFYAMSSDYLMTEYSTTIFLGFSQ